MYNNNEVVGYLQANKILALKLDHAVSTVGELVRNQVETFMVWFRKRRIVPIVYTSNIQPITPLFTCSNWK